MAKSSFETYQKRRLQSSYISVIISISIVLFMVGVLGLILLKSTSVANHLKEQIRVTLFLKDNITKDNIENLRASLLKEPFTKEIVYITKEDAAKEYSKEIGEDFLTFLGTNPIKNGIDLFLKAEYVTPEKVASLEKKFLKNTFISSVSYEKPLIDLLTKNIQRISFWLLVISGFFVLVAIILINSSIRLSIYSKRFNIKTMQMVGATKSFIRKPFIYQSIKLALFGAILAICALFILMYYIDENVPSVALLNDYVLLGYLTGSVILTALLVTWISTYFATQRFLNLQTEELYY